MTAYLIFGYLSEGDGRMDKAWNIVKRDFFDIVTLAAISTFVNMLKRASRRRNKSGVAGLISDMIRSAAGLLEVLWTEASYLILPAMVIEDLNLKDGARRVWNIAQNNLVLVGISTVGVRAVTFLIGVLLWLAGAMIGFVVLVVVGALLGSTETAYVIALVIGALIFIAFTLVASIISTYTAISYHTCLYIWAREAERAQALGQPIEATAPAPLAAVLALG